MENDENTEILELVKKYRAPENAKNLVAQMKIALIVGIAAAGKDSVKKILLTDENFAKNYAKIITTITRKPREGEIQDVNYHFITDEIARKNLTQKKYFEAKIVHGKIYGTTISELEKISRDGKIALGDVDVQGVFEFHEIAKNNLRAVFVIPPNFEIWQKRWQNRGEISRAEKLKRTESAVFELDFALKQNYYRFVVNDNLNRAAEVCDQIFRGAEKNYKDEFARIIAEKLLDDTRKNLEILRAKK